MTVEPICPGCRSRRNLLRALGVEAVFSYSSLPPHLPNCPARTTLNLLGITAETFLELSRTVVVTEIACSPEFVILDRPW